MLKDSLSLETAIDVIAGRQKKLDVLQAHTAQKMAEIATKDKKLVFDKLRQKVKDAADYVAAAPISGEVGKDMSDVASVRREAEALFGKFQADDTKSDSPTQRSNQLNFLVGVQLVEAAQSRNEKPVQASVIHTSSDEELLLEL